MLYFEDYLEIIEHLPLELRDRLTEMREMDLSVQNHMDEMEDRVSVFFNECRLYENSDLPPHLEEEFKSIKVEYYKALEDADEKVTYANQMYELVDKYLRRLDTEVHKFKCELEADNKGITEIIEKRSLEIDVAGSSSNRSAQQQKENRVETFGPRREKRRGSSNSLPVQVEKKQPIAPPSLIETRHSNVSQAPPVASSNVAHSLGHIGAGPAIAAAASQAIAATQQMQQGRRTASLKASYEAIHTGGHGREFTIGRELAGAAQTAIQAIQKDHGNPRKKQKRCSTSNVAAPTVQAIIPKPVAPVAAPVAESPSIDISLQNDEVIDGEWICDPDEPKYCICKQVSYGTMVGCDNEYCPIEWFHCGCVGITVPPKGIWFCASCAICPNRKVRKN